MKKKKLLFMCICLVFIFATGCDEESKDENKKAEKNNTVNFYGDFDYIVENETYNYTGVVDKVYKWGDDVYLPIEKVDGLDIEWAYNHRLYIVTDNVNMDNYIEKVKKSGFNVYTVSGYNDKSKKEYYLYNDKIMIELQYVGLWPDKDHYNVNIFMTPVTAKRTVTVEDTRRMLDESGLIDNPYFDDYIMIEIENETVKDAGYYEYAVFYLRNEGQQLDDKMAPYYVVTDGKKILLCEQNIIYHEHFDDHRCVPITIDCVQENGEKKLVVASQEYVVISTAETRREIRIYKFIEDKFVLDERIINPYTMDWRTQAVLTDVVDGKLKYYYLEKENEEFTDGGFNNIWKVKKELTLEEIREDWKLK